MKGSRADTNGRVLDGVKDGKLGRWSETVDRGSIVYDGSDYGLMQGEENFAAATSPWVWSKRFRHLA